MNLPFDYRLSQHGIWDMNSIIEGELPTWFAGKCRAIVRLPTFGNWLQQADGGAVRRQESTDGVRSNSLARLRWYKLHFVIFPGK